MREHGEDAARGVKLVPEDVDVDTRLEEAQDDASGVDPLLRELALHGHRLVPAAEHEEGVRALGERGPLVGAPSDPPRECERLVEVAE